MAYSVSFLRRFVFAAGAFVLGQAAVQAEVKLPSVFSDHMVLQQGQRLPVWGWADPGEAVTVSVAGQTKKTKAGKDGAWDVHLKGLKVSKSPVAFTVKGSSNSIDFQDVLVGEVWLCSGQSNMEWTVANSNNPKEEIANAKHPLIRHIKIPHRPSAKVESDVTTDGWLVCSPETVANFTAVGYFFARNLLAELDVPIGLLGCNWGGTRIEPWTTPSGFRSVPALKDISDKLDQYPQKRDNGSINHQSALALHNGMISPINPYGVRGALWYQGESNNGEGMLYYEKKKALINGWRDIWNNKKMPFYFVQLAPYKYGNRNPHDLAGIWQAQLATLEIPYTGMAVTTDIGNTRDIHPRNKQEVGRRLALWALTKDYGKKGLEYSGPLFKSSRFRKGTASVRFTHADGLKSTNGQALSHWEVAGEDEQFAAAQAEIKGSTVVARSETVKKPKFVRFGYHQEAEPNLANGAGLPASPFTTGEVK